MRQRFILSLLLSFLPVLTVFSQPVEIVSNNTPLNKILIDLRDKYRLQFSFNDQLLSQFSLTVNHKYDSPDEAIQSLIAGLPLTLRKLGDVFMILPEKKEVLQKKYLLLGQIVESQSKDMLPFSHLFVNNRIIFSDQKGSFSYLSTGDSIFKVNISHLGYYNLDTVLVAGKNHQLSLVPSRIGIGEIVIKNKTTDRSTQIGNKPGAMKINHLVARYLSGNDDNSIFTLLRLMPGILASSEQSNGLIIWGAYEGHSQILLDGFTIWGLKSFNDDIDAVNPLIAKEIEVYKGGYDVSYGDRIGGIVRIAGKSGGTSKPSINLNINNVTLNGMAEVPLGKKSSLLMSFRQTYYNLYHNKNIGIGNNQYQSALYNKSKPNIDFTVFPDYNYRDANLKFTTRSDSGEVFYISLLGGEDRFKYTINHLSNTRSLFKINSEINNQFGASSFYGRTWKNGNISNFSASWSSLEMDISDIQQYINTSNNFAIKHDNLTHNMISEVTGRMDNFITLNKSHLLEAGIGYDMNDVVLSADSSGINQTKMNTLVGRFNGYLQDHLTLSGGVDVKFGLRADYPFNLDRFYVQPRISTSIQLTESTKLNVAWGLYNQFITKSSVVDDLGNHRYFWTSCNNKDIPVLKAVHWVAGSSYHNNDLTISIEAYYKNIDGMTRFINRNQHFRNLIYKGEGRSYGLDVFVKKDYRGHSACVSYTLSKTEELFPYYPNNKYRISPQDQRHEVKAAVLFNVKKFNFAANYVYGSGFPLSTGTFSNPSYVDPDYNRMDVSVNYKFKLKMVTCETGVSILNLFNSQNIRYSNFERVPVDQSGSLNIYSEALPFSPRVSLRLIY